jgi:hypothetical protein
MISWPSSAGSLLPDTGAFKEHDVGTLGRDHGHDVVDPGQADGAHLHPDRSRGQRGQHSLVAAQRSKALTNRPSAKPSHASVTVEPWPPTAKISRYTSQVDYSERLVHRLGQR